MDPRMPIGRFARACRLSVKALRHYDELGLLRPAFVDEQTGYRYYARSQARSAIAIALLRSLDLPLETIRRVLASPDDPARLHAVLAGERARLERELARREQALRALERVIREGALLPYEVMVRDEPALTVVMLDGMTTPERMIEDTTERVHALLEALQRDGCDWSDPVLCLLPAPEAEDVIPYEVAAALRSGALPRLPGVRRAELPGGPCAVVRHVGPYEELGLAHHALFAWVQERGHAEAGPLREIYLNDPKEVAPARLETEVLLPIAL